jgi:hypothetical protein
MALLGHSGSQAPQLMHSSVIMMAMVYKILFVDRRSRHSGTAYPRAARAWAKISGERKLTNFFFSRAMRFCDK